PSIHPWRCCDERDQRRGTDPGSPAPQQEAQGRAAPAGRQRQAPRARRPGLDARRVHRDPRGPAGGPAGGGARGPGGRRRAGELGLEAIVRRYGRPSLLIRNGTYDEPDLPAVAEELAPNRAQIEGVIPRVGRVEFVNYRMPWGGTGWVVDRNVIITNR